MALLPPVIPVRITHVVPDDTLIKVYGVSDDTHVTYIEKFLEGYDERLRQGEGTIRSPTDAARGKMVLVPRFRKYKRAEVLYPEEGGKKVKVRFIDIGGTASYELYELRLLDVVPQLSYNRLPAVPPEEYILSSVLKEREWTNEELEVANVICKVTGDSLRFSIHCSIGNHHLLNVSYTIREGVQSFASFLVSRHLVTAVTPEQMRSAISSKFEPLLIPSQQFQVPPPMPPGLGHFNAAPSLPNNFSYPQPQQPVLPSPTNYPTYAVRPTMSAPVPSYPRLRGPRPLPMQTPRAEPVPQNFISDTLPVGSEHEVYVSNVIDGMQNFTVQIKSNVDAILTPLMVALNDKPAEPFTDPLQPGTVCLGRYAADNALCRAVVSTVLADGANLYFVDFGNSEIVPFNEIYKIRPEFMKEKMLAIRFSLAGCSDNYVLSSKEAEKVFENLTVSPTAEPFRMKVTKPETPLKQFCELFIIMDDGKLINIKSKVLDKMKMLQPAKYERIPFKKNSQADVIISFVESPARFFVQLSLNENQLNRIMMAVKQYCATSEDKEVLYVEDVNENMAVCAQYSDDQKWYRALVVNEPTPSGEVEVLFVDYGNQELVHFSNLRIMTNEMISLGPMQAVECRLDFDADLSLRDDVTTYFSELVDESEFAMHVLNVLPAKVLLVDLIDKTSNQNIKDVIKQRFQPPAEISLPSDRLVKGTFRSTNAAQGNWRERQNSANGDSDFSAFKTHKSDNKSGYVATDETDNLSKAESWDRRDRFSSRDSGPKRFDRNDAEQSDAWSKKPFRREESWNQHDDRTTNGYASRDNDDDSGRYRSRGRENDRDGGRSFNREDRDGGRSFNREDRDGGRSFNREDRDGGRSFNREDRDGGRSFNRDDRWGNKGGESWSNRGGDDRERKPYQKRENSSWNAESAKPSRDDFAKPSRNDDFGSKNDSWEPQKNEWSSDKKEDDFSARRGGNRDFKSNDSWGENRRGDRDSKPSFGNRGDRGENRFREKRDFGGGGGSWKNDGDSGSWKQDSGSNAWSAPKAPTMEPAYERGAEFVEAVYQPGDEMEVSISWFINPGQFYIIPAENNDFRVMMESFQSDYSRRERLTTDLQVNECVVARDKDEVIYRARILRTTPRGVIVMFVDYGNSATVKKDDLWAVSKQHCTIPMQAICCKLNNIKIADENTHWCQLEGLESYFGLDKYTLTFVECIEQDAFKTWSVNLRNPEGVDIGDLLVDNGLAVRENVLKSEELYDPELLKNQLLAVFPGAVVSSKKFFVHIEPEIAQIISEKIMILASDEQNLVALPIENAVEGEFCITCTEDKEYYRSLILSVDQDAGTAHIVYIDFGDENDVALDSIKQLPDFLRIYDAQIVECCLHEGEGFEDEEAFSAAIGNTDFLIKVVDVIDNKLHVILYDIAGNRLPFPTAVEESVSPLTRLPALRSREKVVITHIDKEKVFIQRVTDAPYISQLLAQLADFYDAQEVEKVPLEADKFYAAKSGAFQTWYRCTAADAECREVFYIDYGNTEPVDDLISLKLLDKQFHVSFMFCAGISTSVQFTGEDLTPLIETVQDLIFEVDYEKLESDQLYGKFVCESSLKTLADYAVETGCGEAIPIPAREDAQTAYTVFANWNINEEQEIRVCHVESLDKVYLQSAEDQPKIEALQEKLQTTMLRVLPLVGAYDELIAAQNPIDKKWYRARSLQRNEVFAIDFGSTFEPNVVKKLPKTFKLDKNNYVECCSLNLQADENNEKEAVSRIMDTIKNASKVTGKLEFLKQRVKFIDITADGVSVSTTLTDAQIAQYKDHDVIISHANSLKDFYVQYNEDQDDIFALLERMKEAESWESIEPEADKLFAAQFVDDEQWYRATVTKTEDDGSKVVKFIDYGNEGSSTQFKKLPDDLQTLARYAVPCVLHQMHENTDELSDLFVEYVNSTEGFFLLNVISGGEPMIVFLTHNGKEIEEILTEKKALLDWKLEPANVGDKVVVSHINSPSSFYVRNELATLEEVEAALAELDNTEPLADFAVGDIVAARYPDDSLWYRAKVIDIAEEKTTVLFFDYGNASEVTEIRALPDGAKLTPCSAKHCSFPVPAEQGEWPDVASARFAELTCDGNTVFEITIKEDGDPAIIDLHDHGTSVAEELATICKADLTAPSPKSTKEVVIISHVTDLNAMWIQSQTPQLDEMADEMANVETFDDLESAEVGTLVAAQFQEEWYRASVIQKLESGYKVLFIDYGNDSDITLVKSLPEDLATLAPLAKCCRLKNVPADAETSSPGILEKLKELVDQATTFYVNELDDSEGVNIVSLSFCEDGKELSRSILGIDENNDKEVELASESADQRLLEDSKGEEPVEEGNEVTELRNEDCVTAVKPTTEEETARSDHLEDSLAEPEKFEDTAAEVEQPTAEEDTSSSRNNDVEPKKLNDEENTDEIENAASLTNAASAEENVEKSVTHDTPNEPTNLLPQTGKDVESNSTTKCSDEASIDEGSDKFDTPSPMSTENDYYETPEKMSDVSSVSKELDTSYSISSASEMVDSPSEYAELFAPADEVVAFADHEFLVSHVNGVDSFYVQKAEDVKRIELMEKLLKASAAVGSVIKLERPQANDLAAAKFNGVWFRVKILEVFDSRPHMVMCIDHGNVSSSEELYALPEKLLALPAMAHHCALRLPDSLAQWSPTANEDFIDNVIVTSAILKMKLLEDRDDVKTIDLLSGLQSVTEKLIRASEPLPDAAPALDQKHESDGTGAVIEEVLIEGVLIDDVLIEDMMQALDNTLNLELEIEEETKKEEQMESVCENSFLVDDTNVLEDAEIIEVQNESAAEKSGLLSNRSFECVAEVKMEVAPAAELMESVSEKLTEVKIEILDTELIESVSGKPTEIKLEVVDTEPMESVSEKPTEVKVEVVDTEPMESVSEKTCVPSAPKEAMVVESISVEPSSVFDRTIALENETEKKSEIKIEEPDVKEAKTELILEEAASPVPDRVVTSEVGEKEIVEEVPEKLLNLEASIEQEGAKEAQMVNISEELPNASNRSLESSSTIVEEIEATKAPEESPSDPSPEVKALLDEVKKVHEELMSETLSPVAEYLVRSEITLQENQRKEASNESHCEASSHVAGSSLELQTHVEEVRAASISEKLSSAPECFVESKTVEKKDCIKQAPKELPSKEVSHEVDLSVELKMNVAVKEAQVQSTSDGLTRVSECPSDLLQKELPSEPLPDSSNCSPEVEIKDTSEQETIDERPSKVAASPESHSANQEEQ